MRVDEARGVEKEWKVYREILHKYVGEEYGIWKVGCEHMRKDSEWWNEEIESFVKQKREM